jgi:hypothetical protein
MVSAPTMAEHELFLAKQTEIRDALSWSGEFKWTKMRHALRIEYLRRSLPSLPPHHSVIWKKPADPWGEAAPKDLVMMQACLRTLNPAHERCRLIIDGEKNRARARGIRAGLGVTEVRFVPSHASPYLQLADMIVGFQVAEAMGKIRDLPDELRNLRGARSDCA